MAKSSRLIDQPNDQFPFNATTYNRMTDEFEEIERRYRVLQHAGNESARGLAKMAAEINGSKWWLWTAVNEAEELEREREREVAAKRKLSSA